MRSVRELFGGLGQFDVPVRDIYAQMRKGEIPDIYLQDEKYFAAYKDEIKKLFGQDIELIDQVSIHVRRGDYVDNPFYVDLTETDYYRKAMDMFPGEEFLIFSDDIAWCREQKIFDGCEFSEGNDAVTDMNLMAGCKHNIIATPVFVLVWFSKPQSR